jgi:hypothetical protein
VRTQRPVISFPVEFFSANCAAEYVSRPCLRSSDASERAFALYNFTNRICGCCKLAVSKQVNYIIEIAGTRTLGKSSDFLSKNLIEGVAARFDAFGGRIRVGMADWPYDGLSHQFFIGGQIKTYAGRIAVSVLPFQIGSSTFNTSPVSIDCTARLPITG